MDYETYKNIIKNGDRIDWYGTEVPADLVNDRVIEITNMMVTGLSDLESDLSETKKGTPTWTKLNKYIGIVKENIRWSPYTQNGMINDFYMKKYNKIIKELELENKKPKPRKKPTKKKEEVVKKPRRISKNSNLIFGNK